MNVNASQMKRRPGTPMDILMDESFLGMQYYAHVKEPHLVSISTGMVQEKIIVDLAADESETTNHKENESTIITEEKNSDEENNESTTSGVLWDVFRRQELEEKRKMKVSLHSHMFTHPSQSTVQVALDFLSPESIGEAVRLGQQILCLPNDHEAKLQTLELRKISLYAASSAIKEVQKLVLDPKYRTELGFTDPYLTAMVSEKLERTTKKADNVLLNNLFRSCI